ncbi:MAG: hypothetical protein HYZ53_27145 [Planctomycetes bacterium]|nr:hypothetical protein [Planctomycetota bacterium]
MQERASNRPTLPSFAVEVHAPERRRRPVVLAGGCCTTCCCCSCCCCCLHSVGGLVGGVAAAVDRSPSQGAFPAGSTAPATSSADAGAPSPQPAAKRPPSPDRARTPGKRFHEVHVAYWIVLGLTLFTVVYLVGHFSGLLAAVAVLFVGLPAVQLLASLLTGLYVVVHPRWPKLRGLAEVGRITAFSFGGALLGLGVMVLSTLFFQVLFTYVR